MPLVKEDNTLTSSELSASIAVKRAARSAIPGTIASIE
ncbi:hypothetical protein OHAE_5517 [Ochrobactrum soli]|uniref:Uncharacterized protein n=1 Tax=Ochrobactrum soli TaxID=2448455 RepID=A0A2P9HED3_9HYPH|nr:hypothetical protein OHAE_5517 [[Ochrobactrum] soli]